MAGKDLNYRITVDQSAGTAGIRDFSRTVTSELRKVDQSLDDTGTAAQQAARVLTAMADAAEADLGAAKRAADALAAALGPEMAAKLGQNGIAQAVGDFSRMGVTFDQVAEDADALAAAMKRVDDVQVGAADAGLSNLNGKLNETEGAAAGAKSAMANMIGNSAQDVGAMAGVTGSLGVAIGQMAEYASDASLEGGGLVKSLGSMATVAGPIAAIAGLVQLIGGAFKQASAGSEESRARIKDFTAALREGATVVDVFRDTIASTGKLEFHGMGDIRADLAETNIKLAEFAGLVTMTPKQLAAWAQAQADAGNTTAAMTDVVFAAAQANSDYQDALAETAINAQIVAEATDEATKAAEAAADEQARMARAYQASADAQQRVIDQADAEAAARQAAADATRDQAAALNEQVDAATRAADAGLAVNDALVNYAAVLKDSKASTEDVRDAALALADAQVELAGEQAAVAGRTLTSTQRLDAQNDALLNTAATAKGPARAAIVDYIGAVNQIPAEKMTEIQAAIDAGDLETARRLLDEASATRTAAINADAHTAQAERDIAELERDRYIDVYFRYKNTQVPVRSSTGAGGAPAPALAGPTGPARLGAVAADDTAAAVTGGAIVSPLVVDVAVPAAAALTVDMRGAILGSRYDITRTVRTAVRDGVRLAGTRGLAP